MKNVDSAAKILTNFDMEGTAGCTVGVYFKMRNGRVIGTRLIYPYQNDDDFLTWKEEQWAQFIEDKAEYFAKRKSEGAEHPAGLKPEEVTALQVRFSLNDDSNPHEYCIELTNLTQKKGFDRMLFLDYPQADMYLTLEETLRMQGVRDVAELSDSVPDMEKRRRRKIGNDLPEVMQ